MNSDLDYDKIVKHSEIKVSAKPGKKKNRILSYNDEMKTLVVEIAAHTEDNKANIELVRFLSKELKKKISIKSGFASKNKVITLRSG